MENLHNLPSMLRRPCKQNTEDLGFTVSALLLLLLLVVDVGELGDVLFVVLPAAPDVVVADP